MRFGHYCCSLDIKTILTDRSITGVAMFKQAITRISKTSPRVAIVVALIAVVAISGVILLLTRGGSEANANPAMQPHAARLDRVDGSVGIARAEQDDNKDLDWAEATA